MSGEYKFFSEGERNKLIKCIRDTDYDNEDEVFDLALELEHISIVLRGNILGCDDE